MEKITYKIEDMLEAKLLNYKELNQILQEERDFIIKMDVDSLWKTSEKKRRIGERINKLKQGLLELFEDKAEVFNLDAATFGISHLLRILPAVESNKEGIRKLKQKIDREKDELARLASENKVYVQEYLIVIDDIMSVAVDISKHAQYNMSGSMPNTKGSNCLINAEV